MLPFLKKKNKNKTKPHLYFKIYDHICMCMLYFSSFTYCCLVTKLRPTLLIPHGLVACQASLSMGFPRQEYWSRLPFPPSGGLPGPRIKPCLADVFFIAEPPMHIANHLSISQINKIMFKGHQQKVFSRKCYLAVPNDCLVLYFL